VEEDMGKTSREGRSQVLLRHDGISAGAIERLRRPWMERFRCSGSPLKLKRLSTMRII